MFQCAVLNHLRKVVEGQIKLWRKILLYIILSPNDVRRDVCKMRITSIDLFEEVNDQSANKSLIDGSMIEFDL
jgi:hypothetical protein